MVLVSLMSVSFFPSPVYNRTLSDTADNLREQEVGSCVPVGAQTRVRAWAGWL